MPRQPLEAELQHDLGRALRPGAVALDVHETFEKAADVPQQAGKFRAGRVERKMQALARRDHDVGREGCALAAAAAVGGERACPVGGRARHQIGACEIGAQALAGLQLMRFDERAAVAAATAREPGKWAFGFVDDDGRAPELGDDLALRQVETLGAKAVDLGHRLLGQAHGFADAGAHCAACGTNSPVRISAQTPSSMSSRNVDRGIVAAVFDPPAGVRRGGAVAAKQLTDLSVIQAEHDMREIHRALPCEGDLRAATRACA